MEKSEEITTENIIEEAKEVEIETIEENEAEDSGALAAQTGLTNEQEDFPGGIIGFSLDFKQSVNC